MTLKIITALLMPLLLIGCAAQKPKRMPVTPQLMTCPDGMPAQITLYSPEEAKLVFEGNAYSLKRVVTASGVKYENRDISYWNKGVEATITKKGSTPVICSCAPKSGL